MTCGREGDEKVSADVSTGVARRFRIVYDCKKKFERQTILK